MDGKRMSKNSVLTKITLFLKLYRGKKAENIILLLLYTLLSSAISMVLLVQENNSVLIADGISKGGFSETEKMSMLYDSTENILGIIVVITLFAGVAGVMCLIHFRNHELMKSMVILRTYGMNEKDILYKALADALIYGIISCFFGYVIGYGLFKGFSRDILGAGYIMGAVSGYSVLIFGKLLVFMPVLIILCNLYTDLAIVNRPIVEVLYERNAEISRRRLNGRTDDEGKLAKYIIDSRYAAIALCVFIMLYAFAAFHIDGAAFKALMIMAAFIFAFSYILFKLFFRLFVDRVRNNKALHTLRDITRCFMCARKRRDILLACVISMGTVLICIVSNIRFNISGILRSAYQDNMGYSILVRCDDYEDRVNVREALKEMKIGYTSAYSKLMDYSDLAGIEEPDDGGKFWALVIDEGTDDNTHFRVPEHGVVVESYFAGRCGLMEQGGSYGDIQGNQKYNVQANNGQISDEYFNSEQGNNRQKKSEQGQSEQMNIEQDIKLFGGHISSWQLSDTDQYLSLVNYNVMINYNDWKLGIDEEWSPIFLIDASKLQEKMIADAVSDYDCHIESASGLIDEISQLMKDYMRIIAVTAATLILVISSVFYTLIRKDLISRRTELYMYRVFGATGSQADMVVFGEYIIIALVSSVVVTVAVLIIGELYFYYGLHKHFPFSVPILLITAGTAMIFIFVCCKAAGFISRKGAGVQVIRDE
ncbi:MAG: ABC transporter permease [Lachnospiraceae bacterium]|nr:ABC transporter permease [Lachnospiraceae bacterium]